MTEKRFTLSEVFLLDKPCISDNGNDLRQEDVVALLNEQHETIKTLEKQCTLFHMSSMFSTVKTFKGDLSKRYKYDEETDTIYDTANHYGSYSKILDKKEITLLLNEYNSLLGDVE